MDHGFSAKDCPICYEEFNEEMHAPRTLSKCGHTVCDKCLDDLCKTNQLKCPACIMIYPKPNNFRTEYPKNFTLLSFIMEMKAIQNDLCPTHKQKLSLYDPLGHVFLCSECYMGANIPHENLTPLIVLKNDISTRMNALLTTYTPIFVIIKSQPKMFFEKNLRQKFEIADKQLSRVFANGDISREIYETANNLLKELFGVLYYLFRYYASSHDDYSRHYLLFEKLTPKIEKMQAIMPSIKEFRESLELLYELETPESTALFNKSRIACTLTLAKQVLDKKIDTQLIEETLKIVNTPPENQEANNKLFKLAQAVLKDDATNLTLEAKLDESKLHSWFMKLFVPENQNYGPVEFTYCSSDVVPITQKDFCVIF